MSTKSFDSATYLRGLGWSGPGSSLNNSPHGRAKPVTVAQKKTLSGVGRDRDTAFPWWEMVFTSVAGKVGGAKVEHHRTSTGILSHRPPPPKANAYEELTPEEKKSRGGLNMDAMAHAKLEMARRQLYSGFLRGTVLTGSGDDNKVDEAPTKKRKRSDEADDSSAEEVEKASGEEDNGSSKQSKKERREARRKRKEEKQAKKDAKKRDRKGKETVEPEDTPAKDDGDVEMVVVETSQTLEISTTTTPIEVDPASSSLSKSERRAAKKLRKSLATTAASSLGSPPPSTSASTVPAPSKDHLSPEEALAAEEQAYLEAKAAAKRAEKEERRLAKLVKKALKEKERAAAAAS